MNIWVSSRNSRWRRSRSSLSATMSMSQPVSCEARRTFWPRRPIGDVLLLVGDDDLDPLGVGVEHDLADLGRRQRVDDEGRVVGRPGDDVDLLAAQLLDHRLDAAAAHADAGAHRVDAAVLGDHRDLRPAAGSRAQALISMMPS